MSGWTSQTDRSVALVDDDQERRHTDAGNLRGPAGRVFRDQASGSQSW
jgi:hypothetical protein